MIKKIIAISVVSVLGTFIISETLAGSHIRAWANRLGKKIEKEITPEMELDRIKNEVNDLDRDIDNVKGELADTNVTARLLQKEVEELRKEEKTAMAQVHSHGEILKAASENDKIQWGYRTVDYAEAKSLLAAEVHDFKLIRERLHHREVSLQAQLSSRELMEQQWKEMIKQKEELAAAVSEMETEIKLAKIEQIRSKHQNDGSRMAGIKNSLKDLRKRVMVQRERLVIDGKSDRRQLENRTVDEILGDMNNQSNEQNEKLSRVGVVKVIPNKD